MPAIELTVTVGLVAAAALLLLVLAWANRDPVPALARPLDIESLGDRVLVVAPHPDDEVMNAGGLIAAARERGAHVRVVLLTAGDGYLKAARVRSRGRTDADALLSLGEARVAESRAAATVLGIDPADVLCLGYPDGCLGGMAAMAPSDAAPACANGRDAVPYAFAFRPGAPYRREDLLGDLASIVRDWAPSAVVHPSSADTHADHSASGRLCELVLADLGFAGARLAYVTHAGLYPFPAVPARTGHLRPPRRLAHSGLRWSSLTLGRDARRRKTAAMRRFGTQRVLPHMWVYLGSFVRRNELFAAGEPTRSGR